MPAWLAWRGAGVVVSNSLTDRMITVGQSYRTADSLMLIVCPSCATSYDVGLASLQPNGRQVRCARCRTVWHAVATSAQKLVAAAAELGPERRRVEESRPAAAALAETQWPDRLDEPAAAWLNDGLPRASAGSEPDENAAVGDVPDGTIGDAIDGSPDDAPGDDAPAADAPPIAPADPDDDRPSIDDDPPALSSEDATPAADIESYAARAQPQRDVKRKLLRWPLNVLQSGILALLIANGIVVGWRNEFVRMLPQTASFYAMLGLPVNVRGLDFEDIATATEQHEGVPILVISGTIVNDSRRVVDVPRLRFSVRNAARQEVYSWSAVPPRTMLPPGEAVTFRSRLASPPPEAREILVRFLNRRDIVASDH
jgi:predicted Zn finger-like uncharacterized protein